MLTSELGKFLNGQGSCRLSVLGLRLAVSGAKGQVDGVTSSGSHGLPSKRKAFRRRLSHFVPLSFLQREQHFFSQLLFASSLHCLYVFIGRVCPSLKLSTVFGRMFQ